MVGAFESIVRFAIGIVLFFVLFVGWFLVPFADSEVDLNLSAMASVFYGNNPPTGIVRDIYLASRGATALLIVSWIVVPALSFFFSFRQKMYTNTIVIALALLAVGLFFLSLIWKFFFVI